MAQQREWELKERYARLGPKKDISTLGEWLDRWLEDIRDTVSPRTWRE